MHVSQHPWSSFLGTLRRPSRYLGGEYGASVPDWDTAEVRLLLAFPDLYELGMSHLGLKILLALVNGLPGCLAERLFAPDDDLEQELRSRGLPLLSLESWHPARSFDLVGFSLQYELTSTNLLTMLDLSGIPLLAAARGEEDPLVIGGGPCAYHPEPVAPFFDLFLVGDGEEALPRVLDELRRQKRAGAPRAQRLARLAALPGIYVPALLPVEPDPRGQLVAAPAAAGEPWPRITRALLARLDSHPFPGVSAVAATETTFDRFSIEIARGCAQGCRFCQAGMTYRPVRERAVPAVEAAVEQALGGSGYDEISLTSLSTADYTAIGGLVSSLGGSLHERKATLSVSSLRAYGLPEDLLAELGRVRTTGLTFAPEAGTQRLRDVINKTVSDEDLDESARTAFRLGWNRIKLYFMIGLPTETPADLEGILTTLARISAIGRQIAGSRAEVTASASSFVPRPHTPLQWAAMDPPEVLREKQEWLLGEARRRRLRLKVHEHGASFLEGVLARGDRRLAEVILHAYRAGARFDGWEERLRHDLWQQAFAAVGIDPRSYLLARQPGERLPWDVIDPGVSPAFLEREWRRAARGLTSPPCPVVAPAGPGVARAASDLVATDATAPLAPPEAPRDLETAATPADHAAPDTRDAASRRMPPRCLACGVGCDLTLVDAPDRHAPEEVVSLGPPSHDAAPSLSPPTGRGGRGGRGKGSRPPAPAFDQGAPQRYRLRYAKLDRACYLGHLDVLRDLPRILRRAGVNAHYTLGYHPKPAMTFGPALRLGVPSLGELVELGLQEQPEPADLLARLNRVTTPGLRFLAAARVATGAPRLSRLTDLIEHALLLAEPDAQELIARWGTLAADGGLGELRQAPPVIELDRSGRTRQLAWSEAVKRVELVPPGIVPEALAFPPQGAVLRLLLRLQQESVVRPEEVLVALGIPGTRVLAQARLGCWKDLGEALGDPLAPEACLAPGRTGPAEDH
jgi:radical SAM family uncharacterized protein/radical SAM-linked protein